MVATDSPMSLLTPRCHCLENELLSCLTNLGRIVVLLYVYPVKPRSPYICPAYICPVYVQPTKHCFPVLPQHKYPPHNLCSPHHVFNEYCVTNCRWDRGMSTGW